MGKIRDLFKQIRETKGTFHAKMDLIKDRNGMDLTEAEDIRKRWQKYTERNSSNSGNNVSILGLSLACRVTALTTKRDLGNNPRGW